MIAIRPQLTESQIEVKWDELTDLRDVLKPLYVTKELQRLMYTAGDFEQSMTEAVYALSRIQRKQPRLRAAAREMEEALERRPMAIKSTLQYQAAIFMDPWWTHKRTTPLNEERKKEVVVRK